MKYFCLFALFLVCSSQLCLLGVRADHGDENDAETELKQTKSDVDEVEFESEFKDSSSESKLEFHLAVDSGEAELEVKYYSKSSNKEAKYEYKAKFDKLLEFIDVNNDKVYTEGTDTEVSSLHFVKTQKGKWSNIVCVQNGVTFNCTTGTDGKFTLTAYLVSNVTTIQGTPIRPNSFKLDIWLNYPRTQAGSLIALIVHTASKDEQKTRSTSYEQDEGFVTTSEKQVTYGSSGFFSWEPTAIFTANGATINIQNSPIEEIDDPTELEEEGDEHEEGEKDSEISFAFDVSSQLLNVSQVIHWDPKLGNDFNYVSSATSAVFSFSCVIIALLVTLL